MAEDSKPTVGALDGMKGAPEIFAFLVVEMNLEYF